MTKATRRMRAPHEPSDHSSQFGSASEHPLKLDIDERSPSHPESRLASLSLCLHPETGSKTKSSKPEVLKSRSAKSLGLTNFSGLADRAGVLGITYSRPSNQDAVPRGGARPCKIDRGSLPEKDVFAASAVRHPSPSSRFSVGVGCALTSAAALRPTQVTIHGRSLVFVSMFGRHLGGQ